MSGRIETTDDRQPDSLEREYVAPSVTELGSFDELTKVICTKEGQSPDGFCGTNSSSV